MPWTQKVFDLLRSGPQTYEYLVAEAGALIPPGRAYRIAEANRKRLRHGKRVSDERIYATTDDDIIRTGKRIIISHTVHTQTRKGSFVKFVDQQGEQRIRLANAADSVVQNGIRCNRCGEEIYSNSKFDWVGCRCDDPDLPSWITGGFDAPRFGINGPTTPITRNVFRKRLPRYFRTEFATDGAVLKHRPWVVKDK